MSKRVGRNDPCPCGSGIKFKKCCLPLLEDRERLELEMKEMDDETSTSVCSD